MEIPWKGIGAAIGAALIAFGGHYQGNSSAVAECGVLLEQQRQGFQASLEEIRRIINQ